MAMTEKGIYYPESTTNADFISIFSTLAASIDAALSDFTYDSGWIDVSNVELSGGWESYNQSTNQFSYRRVGKWVACKGRLRRGNAGEVFYTLPRGFRPSGTHWSTAERNATVTGTVNILVETNGNMHTRSTGGDRVNWVPLTGIHYFTDEAI